MNEGEHCHESAPSIEKRENNSPPQFPPIDPWRARKTAQNAARGHDPLQKTYKINLGQLASATPGRSLIVRAEGSMGMGPMRPYNRAWEGEVYHDDRSPVACPRHRPSAAERLLKFLFAGGIELRTQRKLLNLH